MHGVIRERLEEYLRAGKLRSIPGEFEAHLEACDECRDELGVFQEHSLALRSLRPLKEVSPAPGFYARVMERIEAQRRGSIWNAFLDSAFGKRLAIASLALLLVLSGFLFLAERRQAVLPATAETLIAIEDHPPGLGQDPQRDRDTILVTLATYDE